MNFFEQLFNRTTQVDKDNPIPAPPPHSEPEPDVPEPDDETRELVRPVKVSSY
jgi:hypothetical protein